MWPLRVLRHISWWIICMLSQTFMPHPRCPIYGFFLINFTSNLFFSSSTLFLGILYVVESVWMGVMPWTSHALTLHPQGIYHSHSTNRFNCLIFCHINHCPYTQMEFFYLFFCMLICFMNIDNQHGHVSWLCLPTHFSYRMSWGFFDYFTGEGGWILMHFQTCIFVIIIVFFWRYSLALVLMNFIIY